MADRHQLEEQIRTAGERRRRALDQAARELDEITRLGGEAIAAGSNLKRVSELSGISRPTLYQRLRPKKR